MSNNQASSDWHSLVIKDVLQRLNTSEHGLSATEASERFSKYGPNRLPERPPTSPLVIVFRQFLSPFIYILGLAAIISLFLGDYSDAGFIVFVLLTNALIGAYQEWKAEQSTLALRKLLQINASALRDGELTEVAAEKLVPGDVVRLETGNRVPADIRLLSTQGLEIDESLLTGESLPVHKDKNWTGRVEATVADQLNMAFAGSIVTHGRAKGVIVATAEKTNAGQLALDLIGDTGGQPPLMIRMERFSKVISVAMLVMTLVIAVFGVGFGGYSVPDMFMFAVALAVAAIPQGLPVAMTIALAIATTRMARRGVIIRRLAAVEGLGSCTLIATDKTGTLTCNELTVKELRLPNGEILEVTGEGFAPVGEVRQRGNVVDVSSHDTARALARAAVLCNEGSLSRQRGDWNWHGDAVDIALLSFAHKLGLHRESQQQEFPQLSQIPFEPENQYAASIHEHDGRGHVYVKGAPERVLGMCQDARGPAVFDRTALEQVAVTMASEGYRVLAIAEKEIDSSEAEQPESAVSSGLTFLGFAGMIDPLRAGAKDAIEKCHHAGVLVSMITGDHRTTALAIARQLGLASSEKEVLTGEELARKTPEELCQVVGQIRVFARVTPRQKLQIVDAAKRAGHFVAVTGDGVNDAPALRAANIGVAMGKSGTDVAREAAGLVITDDNFATIVAGIEEGRVAYDNIRKVIYLLISTGAAELVVMLIAISLGTPYLPLLPVQLLWLNLVTNGIQDVALAFEPNEGGVLDRPPRPPKERIFDQLMIEQTVIVSTLIGVLGYLTFQAYLPENAAEQDFVVPRNILLVLIVLFENFHVGNCRSETKSAFALSPLRSPFLVVGVLLTFLLHFTMMHIPLGKRLLGAQPITLDQWIVVILVALTVVPVMELHKLTWKLRHPNGV